MAFGYPDSLKYLKERQKPLQFNKNGEFKILHLADIHEIPFARKDKGHNYSPGMSSYETMNVMEKCIEKTNPDLVVFGGDNIGGYWNRYTYNRMRKTIKRIVEPIAKRNIPLAIVFGNHDAQAAKIATCLRKEIQICIYSEYENFRGSFNEAEMHGCGNYNLPILSSDGKKVSWNIWCIDSNDYIRDENYDRIKAKGYGFVYDDQIAWYEKKAEELKNANGGENVPSILFQHIPVNQEWDIIEEVQEGTKGAFKRKDKYYAAKPGVILDGEMREGPCAPREVRSQFESWKKTGDIVAAFFGHDHKNTFIAEIDGVKLVQTIITGYHSYGDERGGRLIVLHEDSKEFDTETLIIEPLSKTKNLISRIINYCIWRVKNGIRIS